MVNEYKKSSGYQNANVFVRKGISWLIYLIRERKLNKTDEQMEKIWITILALKKEEMQQINSHFDEMIALEEQQNVMGTMDDLSIELVKIVERDYL